MLSCTLLLGCVLVFPPGRMASCGCRVLGFEEVGVLLMLRHGCMHGDCVCMVRAGRLVLAAALHVQSCHKQRCGEPGLTGRLGAREHFMAVPGV